MGLTKEDLVSKHNQLWSQLENLMGKDISIPSITMRIKRLKEELNKIRNKMQLPKVAQLRDLRDFRELGLKPLKFPGDPDPVQPITTCEWCGSALNEKEKLCHNCGRTQIVKGQPYQRKTPDKGESPSPLGTNKDRYVTPNVPVIASKGHNKNKDNAEEDKTNLKDVFISDTFEQCIDPRRKNKKNVDRKEEIMRSCKDLEIDG